MSTSSTSRSSKAASSQNSPAEPKQGVTRRRVLQGSAVAAGVTAATVAAPPALAATPKTTNVVVTRDPIMHLLRRATYGPSRTSIADARRLGYVKWIEWQLKPSSISDATANSIVAKFPSMTLSKEALYQQYKDKDWVANQELAQATLLRRVYSNRQLFEIVVEFWNDHLHTILHSGKFYTTKHNYDANVIRRHAFGKFSEMLKASMTDINMMMYLDNTNSRGKNPNENYARELLELHSVSVGHFSEQDVKQTALLLSGFTIDWQNPTYLLFKPNNHYVGPVTILGKTFSNSDNTEAGVLSEIRALGDFLARRPSTARFIAEKLCRRFCRDAPSKGIVDAVAKVYLQNDTAIVPVLRYILNSAEFKNCSGMKFRRPMEFMAATMRVLEVKFSVPPGKTGYDAAGFIWRLDRMEHVPMNWGAPNGYPDVAPAWISSNALIERWNWTQQLTQNWDKPLVLPNLNSFFALHPKMTAGALVDNIVKKLTFQTIPAHHRAALLDFMQMKEKQPVGDFLKWGGVAQVAALVLSSAYLEIR